MCSKSEDSEGIAFMDKEKESSMIDALCRKCVDKKKANVVLRRKDAYCRECFLTSVSHKFRACLGKSRTMKPGDKVLVAFSGNNNSVALLHLIHAGIQDTSHKRLMIQPTILFIDESTVLGMTSEEQSKVKASVVEILDRYVYPHFVVPLELVLESEEAVRDFLTNHSQQTIDSIALTQLFDTLSDPTAKTDLLNKLRNRLLAQVAECLGCEKAFTAESADDLAIKLFSNISLGRGAQLPYDVGFADDRFPSLKLVRPMRDISKKEIAFYNIFQDLPSLHVPSLSTKMDSHSSIQKLTESFLCDLQDGFPGTISTVFRVADKLTSPSIQADTCLLCLAPLDVEHLGSSSLNATKFSSLLSSLGSTNFNADSLKELQPDGTEACCGDGSCTKDNTSCCQKSSDTGNGPPELCYGCSLIIKNSNLPSHLTAQLRDLNLRKKMRKEIEDFLL